MSQELVLQLASEAIQVMFAVAAPMLIAAMSVGILISIFQTATSIQDQTLTFIPKIIAVMVVLLIALPWITSILMDYVSRLFGNLETYIR